MLLVYRWLKERHIAVEKQVLVSADRLHLKLRLPDGRPWEVVLTEPSWRHDGADAVELLRQMWARDFDAPASSRGEAVIGEKQNGTSVN